jgi:hypothetical protein
MRWIEEHFKKFRTSYKKIHSKIHLHVKVVFRKKDL